MKSWGLVLYRVAVVAGIVWCVAGRESPPVETKLGELRTSPSCDDIVGYSGTNDVAIKIGADGKIASVRLLRSGDTVEHAAAVREDAAFWQRFRGRRTANELLSIDGVSRATLTSLAIVEAVAKRLHGVRLSLRFPDEITLDEARRVWKDAALLRSNSHQTTVLNESGKRVGVMLRTGPRAETITGYQGPSSALLWLDAKHVLLRFEVRSSYDNEKYVGYVKDDAYFAESLVGKLPAAWKDIDAVSGATMTSEALVAGMIVASAGLGLVEAVVDPGPWSRSLSLRSRDIGLLIAVALALLLTFSRLGAMQRLRPWTRLLIIGYLGILSGDMLSHGLLVGWVENGLPYGSPGVLVLFAAAIVVPITTGRQVYCHELCAHGAMQELLRRSPWKRAWPKRLWPVLKNLRLEFLGLIALALAIGVPLPWGMLEPFGAWAWPMVGVVVLVFWVTSLLLASVFPMAYCRTACPTGALLDFIRHRGKGDRFRVVDAIAGLILLVAVVRRVGA